MNEPRATKPGQAPVSHSTRRPDEPLFLPAALLPARSACFAGRQRDLERVDEALESGTASLARAVTLSGPHGIGKSHLAIEYAHRHAEEYEHIFFLQANSAADLDTGYLEVARALCLPEKDGAIRDNVVKAVRGWLGTRSAWLLILDGVVDPDLITPFFSISAPGTLLITTPARDLHPLATPVCLTGLEPEDALDLLVKKVHTPALDPAEKQSASSLAEALEGVPLALELATAFVTEMRVSFAGYLEAYGRNLLDWQETSRLRAERGDAASARELSDVPDSVAGAFKMCFRAVAEVSPVAAEVLRLCALLNAGAVPLELFAECALELGPLVAGAFEAGGQEAGARVAGSEGRGVPGEGLPREGLPREGLPREGYGEAVLGLLERFGLIRRHLEARTWSLHPAVQSLIRSELSGSERRERAERLVRALNRVFPPLQPPSWPRCERLARHAKAVLKWTGLSGNQGLEAARLLNQMGLFLAARGRYEDGEDFFRRALSIRERVLGPEHPDVARTLNNLAGLLNVQQRHDDAEPLFRRTLAIREKVFGPIHPEVASSLHNLGLLFYSQTQYADAEPFFRRAAEVRVNVFGPNHPEVASSLHNLAELYRIQGRYQEAEPLYVTALEALEKTFGPSDPRVAQGVHDLAVLLHAQRRYVEAEPYFRRALEIWEQLLGPDHPHVATSYNNLAELLRNLGRLEEAETAYRRALEIFERVMPGDPNLAVLLVNYAMLLHALDRREEAETLSARANEIWAKNEEEG